MKKLQTILLIFTIIIIGCGKENVPAIPLTEYEKAWAPYWEGQTIYFVNESGTDTTAIFIAEGKFLNGCMDAGGTFSNYSICSESIHYNAKTDEDSPFAKNGFNIQISNRDITLPKEYKDIFKVYYGILFNYELSSVVSENPETRMYVVNDERARVDTVWVQHGRGLIKFSNKLTENYYLLR